MFCLRLWGPNQDALDYSPHISKHAWFSPENMKIAVFNLSVTTHLQQYIIRHPEKKLICMHSKTRKKCIIQLLTISLGIFNGSEAGSEVA